MMRRVLILVEGQTEERFVKDVVQPYLWSISVHPRTEDRDDQACETWSPFQRGDH